MLNDTVEKTTGLGRCCGYLSEEMGKDQINTNMLVRWGVCVCVNECVMTTSHM